MFGSTGTIGTACTNYFHESGWNLTTMDRNLTELENMKGIDAVIWAQGANHSGTFIETNPEIWDAIWDANFDFIVKSSRILLQNDCLSSGSRLVIISSVWEHVAKANKSAYISSKAAIGGLIRALACELGKNSIAINGVLPGVIDSPMTRANLTSEQINSIVQQTPNNQLVTLKSIATIVEFLASNKSFGINGQSIVVDHAWAISKNA
jgi:NAD(P)-dependent dehydrogenase (short-subunit alcohol dehydrogenase family)